MKSYFKKLFNYDHYASQQICQMSIKANAPTKLLGLMAHLLVAQQVWLNRCQGGQPLDTTLWPDWNINEIEQVINNNNQDWLNYLNGLNDEDFDQVVSYKNFQGVEYQNKIHDIITQVINHGTHHRAQAGQHLKLAGENLPVTDYIFYMRTLES